MASPTRAPAGPPLSYRFGAFEADVRQCELRKFGIRVRLERKPWQLLAVLLSHHDKVVTRTELQAALWPEGTFVDFEHGLNSAMKKLRGALCDAVDKPRYILTFPGEGYRFIAPVETSYRETAPSAPSGDALLQGPQSLAANPSSFALSYALGLVALVIIAAGIMVAGKFRPRLNYTADDWVLVSDFRNQSGDPALDGVLRTALEREINNSRFVHVVPRERTHDVLALMRRPADTSLDEGTAREVCLRDGGVKLLLSGNIDKVGPIYVLSVNIVDPGPGTTLRSFTREFRQPVEVLVAIHGLGNDLRAALGEQLAEIRLADRQSEKVTTPSLEALRLFNIGYELQVGDNNSRVADFFEQAVKVDPDFAAAWLHLGWAYYNSDRPDYLPAFRRALQLSDRVSERERLFILQSWYEVTGDFENSLKYGETLVRLYPDHYWGANNTALLLWEAHRDSEAIALEKRCLRLRPQIVKAVRVANRLRKTANLAASEEFYRIAKDIATHTGDPESAFWLEFEQARLAWSRADYRQVFIHVNRASPAGQETIYQKAAALALFGHLRAAEDLAKDNRGAANIRLYAAFLRRGLPGLQDFVRHHPSPMQNFTNSDAWLLYAVASSESQRRQIIQQVQSFSSPAGFAMWKVGLDGLLRVQAHDYSAGIRDLDQALERADRGQTPFLAFMLLLDSAATAYEQTEGAKRAAESLERYPDSWKNVDDTGLGFDGFDVLWPMLQRHKADLYRAAGQPSKADAIEMRLASLLVNPDPDYSLDAQRGRVAVPTATAKLHPLSGSQQ